MEVNQQPLATVHDLVGKDDCFICYQKLTCKIAVLPCKHRLHKKCLRDNLRHEEEDYFRCPMCRREFQKCRIDGVRRWADELRCWTKAERLDLVQAKRSIKQRHDKHPLFCLQCLNTTITRRADVNVPCKKCKLVFRMHPQCLEGVDASRIKCIDCYLD